MSLHLTDIITAPDPSVRNQSLDAFCRGASLEQLMAEGRDLETFRRRSENLYERVRALFFLYAIHRFHLPLKPGVNLRGFIPFQGHVHLLQRRFEEAIKVFLGCQEKDGPSDAISSALAAAYYRLGDSNAGRPGAAQRSFRARQSMDVPHGPSGRSSVAHPAGIAATRARRRLTRCLREQTPVRMDLTHSAWSDIFFLGMDYPEGAKVLNVSIDLGVRGRDRRAATADRSLFARDRRTGPATDQRRPGRSRGHHAIWPKCSISPTITWGCSRRRSSRRASCRRASKVRAKAWPICWRACSGRARPGNRQQRQQYSQRLAPGGLDESAGGADFASACAPPARRNRCMAHCGRRNAGWCWPAPFWANGWAAPAAAGRIPAASGRA